MAKSGSKEWYKEKYETAAEGLADAKSVGVSKQMLSHVERNINAPLVPKWWYRLENAVPSITFDELKKRYAVTCIHCSGLGHTYPDVVDGQ